MDLKGKQRVSFWTEVRVTSGLPDSGDTDVAIALATKNVLSEDDASKFIELMNIELEKFIEEEQKSGFQKYNKLEKLSHIGRVWNRSMPKVDDVVEPVIKIESPLSAFARTLNEKISRSVSNMRAARDESAANREKAKTITKELILDTMGMSYIMFSALESATINVDTKEKASYLCDQYDSGNLEDLIKTKISEQLKKLEDRLELVNSRSETSDTTTLLYAIRSAKDDLENISGNLSMLIAKLKERINTDYVSTMCRWSNFKVRSVDGVVEKLFNDKEVNALEIMGGWNTVIKLYDQNLLEKTIKDVGGKLKRNTKGNGINLPSLKGM